MSVLAYVLAAALTYYIVRETIEFVEKVKDAEFRVDKRMAALLLAVLYPLGLVFTALVLDRYNRGKL